MSFLPKEFAVYPELLEAAGYAVGFSRKGWGPGEIEPAGRARNPAGPKFDSFQTFLKQRPKDAPFCFWFGSMDPHRIYDEGTGRESGMRLEEVKVPPMWPDTPEVRSDILDYYYEVQRFDREVGAHLAALEAEGLAGNTIVVISGDNGWPFPRCKANLYDGGTRQPLAVRWPGAVKGGRTIDDFVSLTDLAPTFLEAAQLEAARRHDGPQHSGNIDRQGKAGGARSRIRGTGTARQRAEGRSQLSFARGADEGFPVHSQLPSRPLAGRRSGDALRRRPVRRLRPLAHQGCDSGPQIDAGRRAALRLMLCQAARRGVV